MILAVVERKNDILAFQLQKHYISLQMGRCIRNSNEEQSRPLVVTQSALRLTSKENRK